MYVALVMSFILWYIRSFLSTYSTCNDDTAKKPLFNKIGSVEKDYIEYLHIGKGVVWIRYTNRKYWFQRFLFKS